MALYLSNFTEFRIFFLVGWCSVYEQTFCNLLLSSTAELHHTQLHTIIPHAEGGWSFRNFWIKRGGRKTFGVKRETNVCTPKILKERVSTSNIVEKVFLSKFLSFSKSDFLGKFYFLSIFFKYVILSRENIIVIWIRFVLLKSYNMK